VLDIWPSLLTYHCPLLWSTLTSPWLIKPFDTSADLVYHSATKFLSSHGTVIGGLVVDKEQPRLGPVNQFARLTRPVGFHNMVFNPGKRRRALLRARARREGLRDFGACEPHTYS
jgi:O-acetylhomoserine (thiol)-lyase